MYYEPPYGVPTPPVRFRPMRQERSTTMARWLVIFLCGLFGLMVLAGLIAFLIIFVVRIRNPFSSLLSYPDFICHPRSCGCPTHNNYGESFSTRIVGGKEPVPFTYPWLVALTNRFETQPFCAGFIISSNTILTAAHCLYGKNPYDMQVLAKLHDIRQFNGDRHEIEKWYIHPEYRFNNSIYLNDIALVKVYPPFADDLQPCCLPIGSSSNYPRPAMTSVVGGWGQIRSKENLQSTAVLQHVVLPIVDPQNVKCRKTIIDPDRQICAGYDRLSVDTCAGDSGAPLLVAERLNQEQGYFVAAGIVSYGNRQCDASISSGVYTRVSFYVSWIETVLAYV